MKKSQFKEAIKEEILDILSEASPEDIKNVKAYNDELERTKALSKEIGLTSEANDSDKSQDDGYVNKNDVDDTTDLYVHNDPESMAFENKQSENLEITADEMKILHKNGKVQLKNGSIVSMVKENEDEEPTASQLKGDSISMLGTKLQQITKEMKQVVKKWKDAEGDEKVKLTDRLRELTKIKKELESALS
tara:strand:+ start:148 stop:720 length:573 start_codon:yes stop_codon:yes gene_type:complete